MADYDGFTCTYLPPPPPDINCEGFIIKEGSCIFCDIPLELDPDPELEPDPEPDPELGLEPPALGLEPPALGLEPPALGLDPPALGLEPVPAPGLAACLSEILERTILSF